MLGFTKSLAKEAEKYNVLCNAIAPVAATRMTETVMSKDLLDALKVEYVIPVVGFLCHENCKETGSIFEVGGRWVAKYRWQRSEGGFYKNDFTSEKLESNWDKIGCFEKNSTYPTEATSGIEIMTNEAEKATLEGNKTANSLKSEGIIELIRAYLTLDEAKELIKKVGALFQFEILEKKGGKVIKTFSIDLKNETSLKDVPCKYDALFTMTDDDFFAVTNGKLNPQMAFIQVIIILLIIIRGK